MLIKKTGALLLLATLSTYTLAVLPASGLATADMTNNQAPLETRILASLVAIDPQGQDVLIPLTNQTALKSGNILEYQGHVINHGKDIVRRTTVTLNIPANTELLDSKTLSPSRAKGSVDGVSFQYMPLRTNINGVLQNMPNHFYKAVQWEIENLGAGEVATVKYRVKVK